MKLEEIRNLCEAANLRPFTYRGVKSEDVSIEAIAAWQNFLRDHGENLLAVAEAAEDLLKAGDYAFIEREALENALAALAALEASP